MDAHESAGWVPESYSEVRQTNRECRACQLRAVCTSTAGALDEWDAHESGDGIESGVEGRNRAYASFLCKTLASRTHSAIVEVRAVFESVSAEGGRYPPGHADVARRPSSGSRGSPWPSTTHLREDGSSILGTQSCQFLASSSMRARVVAIYKQA